MKEFSSRPEGKILVSLNQRALAFLQKRTDTDKPEQNGGGYDTANFGTNETSSSNNGAKAKDEFHGNTTTDSAKCLVGVWGYAPGSQDKSSNFKDNKASGNSKLVAAVVYDPQMAAAMIEKTLG